EFDSSSREAYWRLEGPAVDGASSATSPSKAVGVQIGLISNGQHGASQSTYSYGWAATTYTTEHCVNGTWPSCLQTPANTYPTFAKVYSNESGLTKPSYNSSDVLQHGDTHAGNISVDRLNYTPNDSTHGYPAPNGAVLDWQVGDPNQYSFAQWGLKDYTQPSGNITIVAISPSSSSSIPENAAWYFVYGGEPSRGHVLRVRLIDLSLTSSGRDSPTALSFSMGAAAQY